MQGLQPEEENYSIMKTLSQGKKQGQFSIPNNLLVPDTYQQLRAFCVDKKGMLVGEKSDPITVEAANDSLMCMRH